MINLVKPTLHNILVSIISFLITNNFNGVCAMISRFMNGHANFFKPHFKTAELITLIFLICLIFL